MSAVETAVQAIQTHDQLLLDQLKPLEQEAARLKAELVAVEELANEIRSRLRLPSSEAKRTKRSSRKPTKPCAKKTDVMAAAISLVRTHQPIELSELETKLKHKLSSESGFSLSGVALRFKECLASDEFAPDQNGSICIASRAPAKQKSDASGKPENDRNFNVDGSTGPST